MVHARRFPPPWRADTIPGGYEGSIVVTSKNTQRLASLVA
jgi:hypothetical protein